MAHVVEPVDLADVVDRAVARVRRRAPDLEFDVDDRALVGGRRGARPSSGR